MLGSILKHINGDRKLRIAQIAPLWISVPPRTYGGTELMLSNLVEELVKRAYDVTLFASGDSKTNAKLTPIIERGIWSERGIRNMHAPIIRLLKTLFEQWRDFDLIHNHFDFFPFPLSLRMDCPPFLTTLHRPVDASYAETMKAYPKVKYCAISEDHRRSIEAFGVPVAGVVYNGIEMSRYEFNPQPQDYLLYLGRLNREKGVIRAIEIAKQANTRLIVAGNSVGGEESLYFLHEVQPLLNEENVNFRGQVDFGEKIELMKNAKGLLFPIDRREPFGLVMIEAMACGTPVIAFRHGSVPEVVAEGKTGFIVDTPDEMAGAIARLPEIAREDCRKRVEDHFTIEKMVDAYERLYEKVLWE